MGNFTFGVHRVTPTAPKFNVLQTEMEGMKIKSRLKSTDPVQSWTIEIRGRTNSEAALIKAHWITQQGQTIPFNWIVPTFWGGETRYVQYVSMEYENPDGLGNIWNFVINVKEVI